LSDRNKTPTADAFDRSRQLLALGMLALAVIFAGRAAKHLLGPEADAFLDMLRIAMASVTVLCIVSVAYWKLFKLPRDERHLYFNADGFVTNAFYRAQTISWVVTFLSLMALEEMSHAASFRDLPPVFFLHAAMAVMLGVSSSVFFYLNRSDGDDEIEQGSRA
jgi:hypothetical protein